LHVTRLRLSGFKSFVDPAEIAIEPGLTGIVGPNGCGKSNIVEALRWVMGESSAKGLRGEGMDDVIFSGTAGRPAFDLAEVGLQLRGAPRALPPGAQALGIQAGELEVVRRIARGAGSDYRVGGREVRARDVQLLFADAASGSRSASIVGQGQIAALVDSRPTERRRLLEEAAGIGGVQPRRREAELKLQATEANLERLGDLLQARAAQLEALQKQARQAGRYRKLATELRAAEGLSLLARWRAAAEAFAQAVRSLEDATRESDAARVRHGVARERRDRLAAQLADARRAEGEVAAELARLTERLRAAEREKLRLEERRRQQEARAEELAGDRAEAGRALDQAESAARALEDERAALTARLEALGPELAISEREAAAGREALALAEAGHREALAREAQAAAARDAAHRHGTDLATRGRAAQEAIEAAATELAGLPVEDRDEGLAEVCRAVETAEVRVADCGRALAEARRVRDAARSEEESARAAHEQAEGLRQELAPSVEADAAERRRRNEWEAALAERRRRVQAREADRRSREEQVAAARAALDLDRLREAAGSAERAAALADATAGEAAARLAEAESARATAADAVESARRVVERLAAEHAALVRLLPDSASGPLVLEAIRVSAGHARALAAALGDDLMAGLEESAEAHWRHLPGDGPPLPDGARPLADLVEAPPALRRRLAQVGLVEPALGPALQPRLAQGQRLVSLDGALWRWDGLVRRGGGQDPAAVRLEQRARRGELSRELESARPTLAAAERALAAAAEGQTAARALADAATASLKVATTARDEARARLAAAETEDARLASTSEALLDEAARLDAERAELEQEAAAIAALDRALAGAEERAEALARAREAAAAAAQALALKVAALRDAERAVESAIEAEAAAGRALSAAEAERQRLVQAQADRRHATELRRATLGAERARLDEELARLQREAGLQERTLAAATAEAEAAALAAVEAGELLAEARAAVAGARAGELAAEHERCEARLADIARELLGWEERRERARARLAELETRLARLAEERAAEDDGAAAERRALLEREAEAVEARQGAMLAEIAQHEAAVAEAERELQDAEEAAGDSREARARAEAERARLASAEEAIAEQLRQRAGAAPEALIAELNDRQRAAIADAEALALHAERLRASRERLGAVNLRAEEEAAELEAEIAGIEGEREELRAAIARLRSAIATLNREGRERLTAAFEQLQGHFQTLFRRLFGGGEAYLRLHADEDPLDAGLELEVRPPGKKLSSLSLLSGGEKALTATALIFALFLTQPSPLCVLDEVDAPLDDANVTRLIDLMEEIAATTGTRFLVVTHHALTMARMARLYGVTMPERGLSQLVSVALEEAVELRATA
jgi:chromosome segregation protein